MRKYITLGKSVAPRKQADSVATSSKSPPRAAPKNLNQDPLRRTETKQIQQKNRPEDRPLQN
jgi:hypothetical protein